MAEVSLLDGGLSAVAALLTAAFGIVWKRQDRHEDATEHADNELWVAVNETRTNLSNHREIIAKEYITKEDFRRLEAKIDKALEVRR